MERFAIGRSGVGGPFREIRQGRLMEYDIQPPTRRCSVTGRELRPGERFFTALVEEQGRMERRDFAPEAWKGPPGGTFGYWCGKVPPPNAAQRPRFDDDLLEECFQRLEGAVEPAQIHFRYVVALLLVRRRRFRLEEALTENGQSWLRLRHARSGEEVRILDPRLSEDEMNQVQDEVFRVLGWN